MQQDPPGIDISALLSAVHGKVLAARIRYIDHEPYAPDNMCDTHSREIAAQKFHPEKLHTRSVATTIRFRGGDCDDLAILYAHLLMEQSNNPNLEFGVVDGYTRMTDGSYGGHTVLAIRDLRSPRKFELYDTSVPKLRPVYIGSFDQLSPRPRGRLPRPKNNRIFIMNEYLPVTASGKRNLAPGRRVYFVR